MINKMKKIVCLGTLCLLLFGVGFPALAQQKLNLNQATVEQLVTLKGIGEKTALNIVEYRQAHGAFSSIEEVVNVKGVGQKTLDRLRDLLTVAEEKTN
jgi:competence protein ComEA